MAYTPTYTSDDLDDIAVDGVGHFGVQIVALITLIALAATYAWFRKKAK